MRSNLLQSLLACAFLGLVTAAAPACINDREVEKTEREFKSQYEMTPSGQERPAPESPEAAQDQPLAYGILGLGSAMLLGAFALTLTKPARRA